MMSDGHVIHLPLLDFTVLGTPVQQGSTKSYGGGRTVHSNEKDLKPWRATVQFRAEQAIESFSDDPSVPASDVADTYFPLDGPVCVVLDFTVKKPTTAPRTRTTWPSKRPDLDKMIRSVLDALVPAGVFKDDGQVVEVRAKKMFPNEGRFSLHVPGVRIAVYRIAWLEEESPPPGKE